MENKKLQIQEDEKLTQDPSFWDDPKKAEVIMRQIRTRKMWVEAHNACHSGVEDLFVLYDFFKEGAATEEELDEQYQSTEKK
ncbi:MAG: peptide chain release factor 2, partial [Bacteroidota bacterium]